MLQASVHACFVWCVWGVTCAHVGLGRTGHQLYCSNPLWLHLFPPGLLLVMELGCWAASPGHPLVSTLLEVLGLQECIAMARFLCGCQAGPCAHLASAVATDPSSKSLCFFCWERGVGWGDPMPLCVALADIELADQSGLGLRNPPASCLPGTGTEGMCHHTQPLGHLKKYLFFISFTVCDLPTFMYAPCECLVPEEVRRGHRIPWSWSHR